MLKVIKPASYHQLSLLLELSSSNIDPVWTDFSRGRGQENGRHWVNWAD